MYRNLNIERESNYIKNISRSRYISEIWQGEKKGLGARNFRDTRATTHVKNY